MKANRMLVWVSSLVTLGSGVISVLSVMHPRFPPQGALFEDVFPLEFFHLSRFLTLLIAFALIVASLNLFRRKRRAFLAAFALACVSIPLHIAQGLDYRGAVSSCVLVILLLLARRSFTVRSEIPNIPGGLLTLARTAVIAFAYGVLGFWLLDRRQFGINFTMPDAIQRTLHFLVLAGDPEIVPKTRYARWFLDSLYLTTIAAMVYSFYSIYRPILFRFRTYPRERRLAAEIVSRHGRSALDFFKYWPDKSYFFSPSRTAFLAYRVGGRHAIVLGDPVGPEDEIEPLIRSFKTFCVQNDWELAIHQASRDLLHVYARLGFRKLKIGDDAIVDLTEFTLEGRHARGFRNTIQRFEKAGFRARTVAPPIPDPVLAMVKDISDEWLRLPGRRERQFTLGLFEPSYVRSTPIVLAEDADGKAYAFVNRVPSFVPGEATIDLMRHRTEIPNGVMDFLFVKLFLELKEKGFTRFNLGMAPMAGFQEREESTAEVRAIHFFFQHLNFLFNYSGLRAYKAKFASSWEPRYLIYQHPLDLPAVALALRQISELRRSKGADEVEPIVVE